MASSKYPQSLAKKEGKRSQREGQTGLATPSPLAEVAVASGAVIEGAEMVSRPAAKTQKQSLVDRFLGLLSAVPFGITLLVLLITACMIGMLIQQQDLESFGRYYAGLTPAEKLIYGRLGFFNIYHAWYFTLLLLLLSLNIILASIDHFPAAWSFIRRKKLTASPTFVQAQRVRDAVELPGVSRSELVERARQAARAFGFKVKVTDEETRTTIFAERGVWNRLGAYAVHVALLTTFFGGFLTARYGHTGGMWLEPGQTEDRMMQQVFDIDNATANYAIGQQALQLPFQVEGLDLQQKLIDKNRSIDLGNTIDWFTWVKITDETGEHPALIHLNKPFDYRGYRFFQASWREFGSARSITLRITPEAGGSAEEKTLKRNQEATLADGTRIRFVEFNPDFRVDANKQLIEPTGEYNNPAAHLAVIKPTGERREAWAFTESFLQEIANAPFMKSTILAMGGFQFVMTDFEKVGLAHMLSIQYDPGINIVYLGFALLCLTLINVFFFSHQRLWIVVEGDKVYFGGDANRNRLGFEDRVKKLIARIREPRDPEA